MLYRFTGTVTEAFPTIITADGVLVVEPGDIVELDTDPAHPRLELVDEPTDATHVGTLVVDDEDRPLAPGQTRVAPDVEDDVSLEATDDPSAGPDVDDTKPRSRRRGATTEES